MLKTDKYHHLLDPYTMNLPSCKPGMTFFTSHSATPSMARLRPRNQRMGKGHWEEQRVNALISWLQQYDLICRSIAWTQCKMQNSFNNINNYIIYIYIIISMSFIIILHLIAFASRIWFKRNITLLGTSMQIVNHTPRLTFPLFQLLLLLFLLVPNLILARRKEGQQRLA